MKKEEQKKTGTEGEIRYRSSGRETKGWGTLLLLDNIINNSAIAPYT